MTPNSTSRRPQVKMGKQQTGYDPLAAVSIMEQMRTANAEMRQPGRLWIIGHLPIVRQFQVLGALLVVFILLALVMLFLNTRVSTQADRQRNHRDRNADAFAAPRPRDVACGSGQRARVRGRQGLQGPLSRRPRCADQGRQRQGREHRCRQQRSRCSP